MKVGVLGYSGSIGKRHYTNLKSLGVDTHGYDSIERNATNPPPAVIRQEFINSCDAIVIATPTSQHLTDIADCSMAGKHLFVEKPLVADLKNNIEVWIDKAAKENRTFRIGNNLRYHACVHAAKQRLPEIGKPLWAAVTVGQFTDKEPYLRDGVSLNWGSHEIDLALYLLGPANVRAACVDSTDTIANVVLHHLCGCHSVVHLDYVTKPEIRATTIVGDKGQIVIDLVQRWCCLITSDNKRDEFQATDSWDVNYLDEIKDFLNGCKGMVSAIQATGADGLRTMKVIESIREKAIRA